MASTHPKNFSRSELRFWMSCFLASEVSTLLRGKKLSPEGAAHMAAEFATASVFELRRIQNKETNHG